MATEMIWMDCAGSFLSSRWETSFSRHDGFSRLRKTSFSRPWKQLDVNGGNFDDSIWLATEDFDGNVMEANSDGNGRDMDGNMDGNGG
jgi:hypothetical protein